jgi:pyruvate formate lyase activating enzyme
LLEQSTGSSSRSPGEFTALEQTKTQTQRVKGTVFDIQRFAIHDGPGIRTLVFMKGCPLRCWWCQNPEGLSIAKSLGYYEYRCIESNRCVTSCPLHAIAFDEEGLVVDRVACDTCALCVEACPTGALSMLGREIGVDELMREIEKDVLLYDSSGGGVTFSGGEPLFQPVFLRESLIECKRRGLHTALETSGYAPAKVFESVVDYVDLFLFDLKLLDDEEHRKYTGVSNRVIKRNLSTLVKKGGGRNVILRFPVITGINDTEKNVEELAVFVQSLGGIGEVDLLPYHDVSEKYRRLGLTCKMHVHVAPSDERLRQVKKRLEDAGVKVGIRG